jgi:hypothetical protein
MVTKLLVVTSAKTRQAAFQQAKEFANGCSSLFESYSVLKMISENNDSFENLGHDELSYDESKDIWFDEYKKGLSESDEYSFEEWLKSKKYLLRDISSFDEVQTLAREIASQHLIYGDVFTYMKKFSHSKRSIKRSRPISEVLKSSFEKVVSFLFKSSSEKSKDLQKSYNKYFNNNDDTEVIDYQYCKEYFMIMQSFQDNQIENHNDFSITEHSFFLGNFGFDQIAHYKYNKWSHQGEGLTTWVVLIEILW